MSDRTTELATENPASAGKIAAIAVGLTALLSVLLLAFALPAVKSAPHEIPVGVVGPAQVATQLNSAGDTFDVTTFDDEGSAREAILDREVYGALVVSPDGVRTLKATAASATVATVIEQAGTTVAAAIGTTADVVDVRAFPADDPRGAGLGAGALPLALGGFIGAVAITQLFPTTRRRITAVAAFAVVAGFGLTAVLQYVLGTFDGNYLLTSLAAVLGLGATAATVLGLRSLLGAPGIGVAAVLVVLLGNPLSGLASAPEMLPTPWGDLGQLLPPGATGTLLRHTAFFDGSATLRPIVVLVCWLAAGLALTAVAFARGRRTVTNEPDGELVPQP